MFSIDRYGPDSLRQSVLYLTIWLQAILNQICLKLDKHFDYAPQNLFPKQEY